jgi:hypothetical protein
MNRASGLLTPSLVIIVAVAAVLGAVGGYVLRSAQSNTVGHMGVVVGSGVNGISVESDGWTYSVPLDVTWIDAAGSLHDGGRPECLPPGLGSVQIRFHSIDDLDVAGNRWRQVVMVDCRGSGART